MLIDREKLLEVLKAGAEFDEKYADKLLGEGAKEIADIIRASLENSIKDMPTIDPVKHGRWKWMDEHNAFLCTECWAEFRDQPTRMGKPLFDFCPFCGALMREDGEEDE